MKATIYYDKYRVELDNEAIKAIRFCYGLPTDLRINTPNVDRHDLFQWVSNNDLRLFGIDFLKLKREAIDDDWGKYEALISNVVHQIIYTNIRK